MSSLQPVSLCWAHLPGADLAPALPRPPLRSLAPRTAAPSRVHRHPAPPSCRSRTQTPPLRRPPPACAFYRRQESHRQPQVKEGAWPACRGVPFSQLSPLLGSACSPVVQEFQAEYWQPSGASESMRSLSSDTGLCFGRGVEATGPCDYLPGPGC